MVNFGERSFQLKGEKKKKTIKDIFPTNSLKFSLIYFEY